MVAIVPILQSNYCLQLIASQISVSNNSTLKVSGVRMCCFVVGGEVTKPRFTQYFRGSLSGLTIRPGTIESQKVISCLQACKEGLDINSLESLDKSIKVAAH